MIPPQMTNSNYDQHLPILAALPFFFTCLVFENLLKLPYIVIVGATVKSVEVQAWQHSCVEAGVLKSSLMFGDPIYARSADNDKCLPVKGASVLQHASGPFPTLNQSLDFSKIRLNAGFKFFKQSFVSICTRRLSGGKVKNRKEATHIRWSLSRKKNYDKYVKHALQGSSNIVIKEMLKPV